LLFYGLLPTPSQSKKVEGNIFLLIHIYNIYLKIRLLEISKGKWGDIVALIGFWPLHENYADNSGNPKHGTPTDITFSPGITGQSAFNGTTSLIEIEDSVKLNPKNVSISV
jgi:hypothetical protein